MPIPYHPRRPKPLAVPTEDEVAEVVAPAKPSEVVPSVVRDEPVTAGRLVPRPPTDKPAKSEATKHGEE